MFRGHLSEKKKEHQLGSIWGPECHSLDAKRRHPKNRASSFNKGDWTERTKRTHRFCRARFWHSWQRMMWFVVTSHEQLWRAS